MTINKAQELLEEYNKEPFHLYHAKVVGRVMRYFAGEYDPGHEDFWETVGLLHDIDFEQYPDEHCVKGEYLLRENGVDEELIRAAMSHGWGQTATTYEPSQGMEKILFATDELTGLIGAAALMRPSKSVQDMEASSVLKKFKDKKFAAGCSRDVIRQGADMLGWTLEQLVEKTLSAMKATESQN